MDRFQRSPSSRTTFTISSTRVSCLVPTVLASSRQELFSSTFVVPLFKSPPKTWLVRCSSCLWRESPCVTGAGNLGGYHCRTNDKSCSVSPSPSRSARSSGPLSRRYHLPFKCWQLPLKISLRLSFCALFEVNGQLTRFFTSAESVTTSQSPVLLTRSSLKNSQSCNWRLLQPRLSYQPLSS